MEPLTKRGVCQALCCENTHFESFLSLKEVQEKGYADPKDYHVVRIHNLYEQAADCYYVHKINTLYKLHTYGDNLWYCRPCARLYLINVTENHHHPALDLVGDLLGNDQA